LNQPYDEDKLIYGLHVSYLNEFGGCFHEFTVVPSCYYLEYDFFIEPNYDFYNTSDNGGIDEVRVHQGRGWESDAAVKRITEAGLKFPGDLTNETDVPDYSVVRSTMHYARVKINFDSYMLNEKDLNPDITAFATHRLLSVDRSCTFPKDLPIRLIITAADVIHSWTIPSFGVKMDAVPGRLNQIYITVNRSGLFYGQCSELCGVNHSFMPIMVKVYNT
jgi:heme/copper-type cytochrome/quinol oxidase subunit 2